MVNAKDDLQLIQDTARLMRVNILSILPLVCGSDILRICGTKHFSFKMGERHAWNVR